MAAGGRALHFNIGVLGHVDSGKTALVRALTAVRSTACLDKCRQSQERGITIDLGFSSFSADAPEHIARAGYASVQYTLVDCPGHASLIKTIMGGAQIIDMMILVVDIGKGVQTQTSECIVLGEILCSRMVVVINKVDLVTAEGGARDQAVRKMRRRLLAVLRRTRFRDSPVVATAAQPTVVTAAADHHQSNCIGVDELIGAVQRAVFVPARNSAAPLLCAMDHCFAVRGHGTVLTGTVLQGTLAVNQLVDIPMVAGSGGTGGSRRVKSLQVFGQSVPEASAGARVGVGVTNLDPKLLERGYMAAPGYLSLAHAVVIEIFRVPYFRGAISSKGRYHVTLAHETVTTQLFLFGCDASRDAGAAADSHSSSPPLPPPQFDMSVDREYRAQLCEDDERQHQQGEQGEEEDGSSSRREELASSGCWALLHLDAPVVVAPFCRLIGSRLDMSLQTSACRLAFHGRVVQCVAGADYRTVWLPQLRVYRCKQRQGVVERAVNRHELIVRGMFKKESNLAPFQGLSVQLSSGESAVIASSFGMSGKIKLHLTDGVSDTTAASHPDVFNSKSHGKNAPKTTPRGEPNRLHAVLKYRRYIFDPTRKIFQ